MNISGYRPLFEARGLRALGSLVQDRACSLLGQTNETPVPSSGIYYVLRFADGWRVLPYRYAEFPGEVDHSELWEDIAAPVLAQDWAPILCTPPSSLERRLKLHTYGFPRGRIFQVPSTERFTVLHGEDLRPFMGVEPALIERLFGLDTPVGTAIWEEDEHEHCQEDDRDAVRQVLRLPEHEVWAAV